MLHVAWGYIEAECVKCAPVVAIDHFQNSHSRYNRPVLEHMTKTITLSLTDFFMVDARTQTDLKFMSSQIIKMQSVYSEAFFKGS